jgi:hypothetical protein
MAGIAVVACILVFIAMMIDLVSGLYKAKLRNEVRNSEALKRTVSKFITYEGCMFIAFGVDCLMHFSAIYNVIGVNALNTVPVVTCLIGIFMLAVEFLSLKEKASEKTKKTMNEVVALLKGIPKDKLVSILQDLTK